MAPTPKNCIFKNWLCEDFKSTIAVFDRQDELYQFCYFLPTYSWQIFHGLKHKLVSPNCLKEMPLTINGGVGAGVFADCRLGVKMTKIALN